MNKFHEGYFQLFNQGTAQDQQKTRQQQIGDRTPEVGTNVGLCDQMNANALFCIYCDFVFSLFQTTALILLPINADFSVLRLQNYHYQNKNNYGQLVRSNVFKTLPSNLSDFFDQGLEICYTETQGQTDTDMYLMDYIAR